MRIGGAALRELGIAPPKSMPDGRIANRKSRIAADVPIPRQGQRIANRKPRIAADVPIPRQDWRIANRKSRIAADVPIPALRTRSAAVAS